MNQVLISGRGTASFGPAGAARLTARRIWWRRVPLMAIFLAARELLGFMFDSDGP